MFTKNYNKRSIDSMLKTNKAKLMYKLVATLFTTSGHLCTITGEPVTMLCGSGDLMVDVSLFVDSTNCILPSASGNMFLLLLRYALKTSASTESANVNDKSTE